ncbi:hypothetical protein E3N88_16237 [Mikania micrantha]|uniref:Homeobox domain-containing protein n=1 Tax=Mikania micrantha TaxID=192012 RepID=A0A5N6NZ43_9ASTR|nr:hypothetical protein E3N88_16237 [Mikania micrantha]
MATYFNGNLEIQGGDGLQTLVLMNPGYVYYPDSQQSTQPPPGNFMFLDSNHPGNNPVNNHHHHAAATPSSSQTQQFVGIPLSAPPASFVPRSQYMYSPVEMVAAPSRDVSRFQQGLSLSLSSQQSWYGSPVTRVPVSPTGDDSRSVITRGTGNIESTSSASGISGILLNSKYLKATQEVLEEVVNVEQRYRQYHHQMLIVISWFEQAAGIGSAKTYTALALQTISKQFRCLKDAIMGQIKAAGRSLGEEDSLGGGIRADGGGSRLKFVDSQLRQQRALQQLGIIQHNAWRPQRGLPERSVSVLRAWLFEHFLHPYPKDSDKHMLAKQTGLTRSQVSNWFINARVRLWKPMVEEMYLEEIKEQEHNGKDDDKTSKNKEHEEHDENKDNMSSKHDKSPLPENSNQAYQITKQENPFHPPVSTTVSTSPVGIQFQNPSGFSLIETLEPDENTQFSPKKPRHDKHHQQTQDVGFTITSNNPPDFMGGLAGYPTDFIGRFTADQIHPQYSGNGVSLTLGLPHRENLSISGSHSSFLHNQNIQIRRGAELTEETDYTAMNPPSSSHTAAMYESMNIQNRKRFAAQPLPDFVA